MVWLICVVGCLSLAWRTWARWGAASRAGRSVGLVATLTLLVVAWWLWPGLLIAQKAATNLVMPVSLVWLLLIGIVVLSWRQANRRMRWVSTTALILFTLCGNCLVAWAVLSWLEGPYRQIDATAEGPFDIVFVLGGGLGEGPDGQLQFEAYGDRLALGARLYLSGQAERLACSGSLIPGYSSGELDPAEIAAGILGDLRVPEDHIVRIPARNTLEELEAIGELAGERGWKRMGLVTSAWHMRRAMRLAERAGVEVEPLPADFRSAEPNWWQWLIVPDATSLLDNTAAAKEILAMGVGR